MRGDHRIGCDSCGGEAVLRLETSGTPDHPTARIFTCENCCHVMWRYAHQATPVNRGEA